MSYKLVLVRHGESEWNKANLFTGWTDVDLSEAGVEEAKRGGQLLKEEGFEFDICYTPSTATTRSRSGDVPSTSRRPNWLTMTSAIRRTRRCSRPSRPTSFPRPSP